MPSGRGQISDGRRHLACDAGGSPKLSFVRWDIRRYLLTGLLKTFENMPLFASHNGSNGISLWRCVGLSVGGVLVNLRNCVRH